MKKLIPITIIIASLLIAGAVIYTNYSGQKGPEGPLGEIPGGAGEILSPQEAAEKVINFVNQNVLKGENTASLIEVLEESGLYRVRFKVEDQEGAWRITKDGELIFPQAIDIADYQEPAQEFSLEDFAKCLTEKGMKFYGAYWCGWCKKQKELFGEAVQYLPYVECAQEGRDELTTQCQEAGITGFPTWQLPDGEKSSGFKSLEDLSQLSGCPFE